MGNMSKESYIKFTFRLEILLMNETDVRLD